MPTNQPNAYAHIATATTTQIYTGQCVLVAIIVNTTAAGSITVYDESGSGTTVVVGILKASVAEGTYNFGAPAGITLTKGLKIVTAGASDITLVYRVG